MAGNVRRKRCQDPKAHTAHPWDGLYGAKNYCRGHRRGLWRETEIYLPATIRFPYFQEGRGAVIHIVDPEGCHEIWWYLSGLEERRNPGPRHLGGLLAEPLCHHKINPYGPASLDAVLLLESADSEICQNCWNLHKEIAGTE